VVANVVMAPPIGLQSAARALDDWPRNGMLSFLASPDFVPGKTYRVLRASDAKLGMYQLIRHGGRLDSEFFPESMAVQSFASVRAYSNLLAARRVDDVVAWDVYDRQWGTNEHARLDELAGESDTACRHGLVVVRRVRHNPRYDLYSVDRSCARHAAT